MAGTKKTPKPVPDCGGIKPLPAIKRRDDDKAPAEKKDKPAKKSR